jgi:hypothetical protein
MAALNKAAISASQLHKDSDKPSADDQETLKYQLLGPSLTKAGQDAVDQQKAMTVLRAHCGSSAAALTSVFRFPR